MKTIQGIVITRHECAFVSGATSSNVGMLIEEAMRANPGRVILVTACDCGCFGVREEFARKSKKYNEAIRSAGAVRARGFNWGSEDFTGWQTAIILDHQAFLIDDRLDLPNEPGMISEPD